MKYKLPTFEKTNEDGIDLRLMPSDRLSAWQQVKQNFMAHNELRRYKTGKVLGPLTLEAANIKGFQKQYANGAYWETPETIDLRGFPKRTPQQDEAIDRVFEDVLSSMDARKSEGKNA